MAVDPKFSLGTDHTAEDAYHALALDRQAVLDMGRKMAELTVPSVFPPDGYKTGDDIPGNNQSMGAYALNTLASELMFMAFPPGQPIFRPKVNEVKLQKDIEQDPELYSRTVLALSRLEIAHREKLQTTPLATAYVGLVKALLVCGNALWKHVELDSPTFHLPTDYVVSRSSTGHPLVTIHKETVRVTTIEDDILDMIRENEPEVFSKDSDTPEWLREVCIYSVCKLQVGHNSGKKTWLYWQEHKGHLIEGTEVETDYDDCPMWPCWMIPVYGQNWGRSYCEDYRGDLFTLETQGSGLNDLTALAAWALIFNKPGSRTSIRQVQKARNLDILSGSAEDLTVFRSEKSADGNFVVAAFDRAARRIGAAFLVQSAVVRDGERVTKEEVVRVGRQLDRAMGGLYTQFSQGVQRAVIVRAVRLNENDNTYLPELPREDVTIDVITGIDAMSADNDANNIMEFGTGINQVFGPQAAAKALSLSDFSNRLAAYKGIKPDGLVKSQGTMDQEAASQQKQALGADLMSKAAGPAAGALAGAMADPATMQQLQQAAQPPQQG